MCLITESQLHDFRVERGSDILCAETVCSLSIVGCPPNIPVPLRRRIMNSVETYLFEECQLRVPSCKYQTVHVVEELQEPFGLSTRQTPHSLGYSKHGVATQPTAGLDYLLKTDSHENQVCDAGELEYSDWAVDDQSTAWRHGSRRVCSKHSEDEYSLNAKWNQKEEIDRGNGGCRSG